MTDVQLREDITEPAPIMPASDANSIMAVISRVAADPSIDIDRMMKLMEMHERLLDREARSAYAAALSLMQPNLPVIAQKGEIIIRDKNNYEKIQQRTKFAKWEDINEAIQPVLAEHGFALSFRTERQEDQVLVTCILSHKGGHSESTMLPLPLDTSGSKNNTQAVGSSLSYGKRYTASALLNITSRGEDDDGKASDAPTTITEEQAEAIRAKLKAVDGNEFLMLDFLKVETIEDIPAIRFDQVMKSLDAKAKEKAQ